MGIENDFQTWQPLYVRLGNLTYVQNAPGAATVNVYLTETAEWPPTELGKNITCFMFSDVPADRDKVIDEIVEWNSEFTTPGGALDELMEAEGWSM